jgi:hypothetical protein
MVSVMATYLPSSFVAHTGGKLREHMTPNPNPLPRIDLVLRSEAKTYP